ncbi:MAG: N-acyl homoserine lactonase family protein [Actinomycetota bacterium]|nr:N-acyl homoserine lactonase family protein [Actinomycetota bacterium]
MTSEIRRLHLGHFTAPATNPLAGQRVVVTAFLIKHPDGLFLLDTGIGTGNDEAEKMYKPVRWNLRTQLSKAGVAPDDVRTVANCHLHFDHAGGNFLFPGTPIFAQAREHALAHEPDYTIPGPVCDFDDARFELLSGEAEPVPGIRIIPTPGHTDGHQSLVVDTAKGRIVLAGQAFNFANEYAAARYALSLARAGSDAPGYPSWVARFDEFDPVKVLFAHDYAIWERTPDVDAPPAVPAVG